MSLTENTSPYHASMCAGPSGLIHTIDISLPDRFEGKLDLKYMVNYDGTLHLPDSEPHMVVCPSDGTKETVPIVVSQGALYVAHDTCTGESLGIFHSLQEATVSLEIYIRDKFDGDGTFASFKDTKRVRLARFMVSKVDSNCIVNDWCKDIVWTSHVQ